MDSNSGPLTFLSAVALAKEDAPCPLTSLLAQGMRGTRCKAQKTSKNTTITLMGNELMLSLHDDIV